MPSKEELLRDTTLFRSLNRDDLMRVAEVTVLRVFQKGDVLFAEGTEPLYLHVITGGRVKVVKRTASGKEMILEIFGPGDPVGAVVAYEGRPYPATAVATDTTHCLLVPRAEFFALLERYPTFVRGYLAGMAQRLAELVRRIPEVSGGRVETRFANLFLRLCDRLGRPTGNGGTFIAFPLSRLELSEMTGTTIETTIRIMSRWKKEDVLSTEAEGFLVINRGALEELAHS